MAGKKGSRRRGQVEFEWAEKERGRTVQAETDPGDLNGSAGCGRPGGETEAGTVMPTLLGGRVLSCVRC